MNSQTSVKSLWVISVTQTFLIACLRFSTFDGCLYATVSFVTVHRFSIGLRSGLFPAHSSTDISFFFRNSMASFDRGQGAPSSMKIVQSWTCMCSFRFFEQFYVLGSIDSDVRQNEIREQHHSTGVSLWLQHNSCQNAYPNAA